MRASVRSGIWTAEGHNALRRQRVAGLRRARVALGPLNGSATSADGDAVDDGWLLPQFGSPFSGDPQPAGESGGLRSLQHQGADRFPAARRWWVRRGRPLRRETCEVRAGGQLRHGRLELRETETYQRFLQLHAGQACIEGTA